MQDIDADVVIIGGGFTGLWSAYYLKALDATLRVVILEGERIGFGASGRNGGWCSALYPTSHGYAEVRPYLLESIAEIGAFAHQHAPEVGFVKSGTITVARNKAQLARIQESTAPHETYLPKGALYSRIGMKGALGGLYTPDCAVIHPGRLVRALAEYLEKAGVTIYEKHELKLLSHLWLKPKLPACVRHRSSKRLRSSRKILDRMRLSIR